MPRYKFPNVRYVLESTKNPKIETYVYLYFVYMGTRLKYATGLKVRPDAWKNERAIASAKNPQYTDVNTALNKIQEHTIEIYRETKGLIEPSAFRLELDYRMGYKFRPGEAPIKVPTVLEYLKAEIEKKSNAKGRKGGAELYTKLLYHLEVFAAEKKRKLQFADIDRALLDDLKSWLFSAPRNLHPNYVNKLFSTFKMCMKNSGEKYHSNKAFEYYSLAIEIPKVETANIVLSFEELEALYNLDLSDNTRLERARDLFLMGAYTGMRYSDFSRITPEHVVNIKGQKHIGIIAQKTKDKVYIPMFVILENLLEKYNFSAPELSGQKLNKYLKELGEVAQMNGKVLMPTYSGYDQKEETFEKWQKLVTHTARRSFATNFVKLGIPVQQVMAITGHKREDTFKKYISIDKETAAQLFLESVSKTSDSPHLKVAKATL